jgi:PST family polysaccharide transporter
MSLLRTSLLNAIAVGVRIVAMLGVNKILALWVGPAGYVLFGQLQNLLTISTTLSGGAVSIGVTKYTAQYYADPAAQHRLWRSAAMVSLLASLLLGALLALLHQPLARLIFGSSQYASLLLWLAASLSLMTCNTLLLAILNGKKALPAYVTANISASLLLLLLTWLLARLGGVYGALLALCLNQALAFFVTLGLCRRAAWFDWRTLCGAVDSAMLGQLARYAAMALTTALVMPLAQMVIRNHLTAQFGAAQAGMWQAVLKISDVYLLLITGTLSVYYLPRLAEISGRAALRREIMKVYRFVLPLAMLCAALLYLLRDWLITLLFSSEFQAMRDILGWQLIGDVIKIGSWVLGFVMLGKAMSRAYIITELVFAVSLVLLTLLLTPYLGLQAAVIAFLINYLLYWIAIAMIISRTKLE